MKFTYGICAIHPIFGSGIGIYRMLLQYIPYRCTHVLFANAVLTKGALYTTGKNMEYLLFQRFYAILWSAQPVSELEIHTYEQILPLGELIST